jgi:homoserine O-acetyltransferase
MMKRAVGLAVGLSFVAGMAVWARSPRSYVESGARAQDVARSLGKPVWHEATLLTATDVVVESKGPEESDVVVKDFRFRHGETLPELRLHYRTLGSPAREGGRITNAVLILHGTGGSGAQFLQPQFAGELFGAGQLLDTAKYYIILPDGIGHGKSSKPSDGLHAKFPQYDYDDMVAAHHALLEHLGVTHLRLILGTSMGCMHSFVWGETYPDYMDALMPLACQPVQIAGRNRVWRKMVMDAIRMDPEWKAGEYTAEPKQGMRTALDLLLIAGSAPLQMQKNYPTRDAADKYLDDYFAAQEPKVDANDLLYAVNASRNYDPSSGLEKIRARMMYVNSADDFINPPELGMAEREIRRVQGAKFVLIPVSDATHGHGTHTWAAVWKGYLAELLAAK